MKHFAIRVGLCGIFVLAAGKVWTQQTTQPPPAIKPGTPITPGTAAPIQAPVSTFACLGEPLAYLRPRTVNERTYCALTPQPIFCLSGNDAQDICAIEGLVNRAINLGNVGFDIPRIADVLQRGIPGGTPKAAAVQVNNNVKVAPPIQLFAGIQETVQAQKDQKDPKDNQPTPESKQLVDEINKLLKMQADSLRSLDIGALYRPGLVLGPGGVGPYPYGGLYPFGLFGTGYPIAAPCYSWWNPGCFNRCYNPCVHPCYNPGLIPFAPSWVGIGGPGVVAPGIVGPGVVGPGVVGPGVVAPGIVGPGIVGAGVVAAGDCGPCAGGPYVEGCTTVLTGRTGFCLMLLPNEARFFLGIPLNQGLFIKVVHPKTPAEAVGYKAGDILIEFDGKPVPCNFTEFLDKVMRYVKNDTPIDGVVLRAGLRVEIKNMILTDRRVIPPLWNECPIDVVLPQVIQLVPGINSNLPPSPLRVRELRAVARPGGITEFIWVDPTAEKK